MSGYEYVYQYKYSDMDDWETNYGWKNIEDEWVFDSMSELLLHLQSTDTLVDPDDICEARVLKRPKNNGEEVLK